MFNSAVAWFVVLSRTQLPLVHATDNVADVRHARVAHLHGILVKYLVESASLREMFADQLQELRGNICFNTFGIRWVKAGDVTLTAALLLDFLACFLRKFHSVRETIVSQRSSIDRRCAMSLGQTFID